MNIQELQIGHVYYANGKDVTFICLKGDKATVIPYTEYNQRGGEVVQSLTVNPGILQPLEHSKKVTLPTPGK